GDDETGWGPDGIFNFEGGCYAKTIKLSQEAEPMIWNATNRFGAVLENVAFDPITRVPDYDDGSKTENTRSAHPLAVLPNASRRARAGHPKTIICLTADAFGVMPPIAKLTPTQAMYHFLSGYTAKVAGTEKGLVGVQPEFSTCFGAPFLPRHPSVYANLLRDYINKHKVDVWLVNSGWTGGQYAIRPPTPLQRARCSPQRSMVRSRPRISVPIRISASQCPPLCQASNRICSIPSRPGKTKPSSTGPPAIWSECFRRILPSSSGTSARTSRRPRRKCESPPSDSVYRP